jgi:hypothetical protein
MLALQPDPPQPQHNTVNLSMECLEGAQFVVGQLELDYTLNDPNKDRDPQTHTHTQIVP